MKLLRYAPLLLLIATPLVLFQLPPVRAGLLSLVLLMRAGGVAGVGVYLLAYCAAALLAAPVALFSAMAGYAWGMPRALLYASPAGALAASCAFLVGRTALRGIITRRVEHRLEWRGIDRALTKDPLRIALLLRATPIVPQNFLSYALAVTRLRYRHFVTATFLGMLPITIVQAWVGSLVRDATELVQGGGPHGPLRWILPAVGLSVSALTATLTARVARKALVRAIDEATETSAGPPLQS